MVSNAKEDSGVCCSLPQDAFTEADNEAAIAEEKCQQFQNENLLEVTPTSRDKNVAEEDEGNGGELEENDVLQPASANDVSKHEHLMAPTSPLLMSFAERGGKMAEAAMNVQLVDKITVTLGGSFDEGSNSPGTSSICEDSGRAREVPESAVILIEPPAEFADGKKEESPGMQCVYIGVARSQMLIYIL
jgi:hypothetical protein